MGVRMTGMASGIDPKLVDQLVEIQKVPINAAKKRKDLTKAKKDEFTKLDKMLTELDGTLNALKSKGDFYKLKVESSHPDILDGVVKQGTAMLGSYEFEVRGLARTEKELAYGFPDKDKTPVGFGYMGIETEEGDTVEVTIDPGATLQDVVNKINEANAGVRAMVINTKYYPDSYRLLVISEKSGKASKISLDEDTTFLEFKEQVTGRDLDVLFEDVPVASDTNSLDDLVEGVSFQVKKAEPGTMVTVNIAHDIDATIAGVKAFVDKYNELAGYIHAETTKDSDGKFGQLAGDGVARTVMRGLQGALTEYASSKSKYNLLADIGITTDPKTGNLRMDEAKVRAALAEDYDGVAKIFIRSAQHSGVADKLAEEIKRFRDPGFGAVKSRLRGLDNVLKNHDQDIERKTRQAETKEQQIRRQFTNLETQMSKLNQQNSFLQARLGGAGAPQGGGGSQNSEGG